MRRPVRTITLPSMPSRMIRFGLPTSSAPSGVIVAALMPNPAETIAAAASSQTLFSVARLFSSVKSKLLELHIDPGDLRVDHPKRRLQQLLARLIALEHDYSQPGHGPGSYRPAGPGREAE